jgi:hypothetical protein
LNTGLIIPATPGNYGELLNIGWLPLNSAARVVRGFGRYKLIVPLAIPANVSLAKSVYVYAFVPRTGDILFDLFYKSSSEKYLIDDIKNNPQGFIAKQRRQVYCLNKKIVNGGEASWGAGFRIIVQGNDILFSFSGLNWTANSISMQEFSRANPTFGQPRILEEMVSSAAISTGAKSRLETGK